MAIRVVARPMLSVFGVALLCLAGCDKIKLGRGGDLAYAQAAIERNDQLEVVAIDASNKVFTIRVKSTGELKTVRADEVIGTLPGTDLVAKPAAAPATPVAAPIPTQTTDTAVPESDAAQPGDLAEPASEEVASASGDAPPQPYTANARPFTPSEPNAKGELAAGPGYSIRRAGGASQMAGSVIRTSNVTDVNSPTAGTSVEHRYEPIICQGGRLLHIDGRNIEFAGDAVSAEDGCEIHITNSRIKAQGVGVFARNANVHIKNSTIEGTSGSVEATNGAQVYVQSSTFKGLSRRLDTATMIDLGGNVWN